MDLRLDKAAQEIGFATGMMVMSLFARMPSPEDPEAHMKAIPGLLRTTDALDGRFARMSADGFTEAVRFMVPVVRLKA